MMAESIEERIVQRGDRDAATVAGDRPVVLRGLVADWPVVVAAEAGSVVLVDYLRAMDAGAEAEVFVGSPEIEGRFFYDDTLTGLNFTRRRATVGGLLASLLALEGETRPPALYMGAAPMAESLPGFTAANPTPALAARGTPRLWLGNAVTVQTHYDLSDNLACVVAGRRTFTLFPPEQTADLYVGPLEFTLAGQPVSLVRLEAPDRSRFPRFTKAERHALTATLAPGDAIYIPPLWWHHVRSHDPVNALVNAWWRSGPAEAGSPFECMVHGLLSIRDLSPDQRAAWRAVFDHYIFAPEVGGQDHIPAAARGILGDLTPATAKLMRRFIIGSMTRG